MNDLEDIIYELHETFDERLLAIEAEEIMSRFQKGELMAFDIEKTSLNQCESTVLPFTKTNQNSVGIG